MSSDQRQVSDTSKMPSALMVYDFDPRCQVKMWTSPENSVDTASTISDSLTGKFSGIIRLATLAGRTIVLTDSQLLDGAFFMHLGPETILGMLGPSRVGRPRIVVRGRARTLEESLLAFVSDDRNQLRHLRLSVVETKYGFSPAGKEFSRFHEHSLVDSDKSGDQRVAYRVAHTIASALDKSPDELAWLANAWQGWIDAEARGLIDYEERDTITSAHSRFVDSAAQYPFETDRACCRVLGESLEDISGRTIALAIIDKHLVEQCTAVDLDAARDQITDWYEFVYQYSLARGHDARWLAVENALDWDRYLNRSNRHDPTGTAHLAFSGRAVRTLSEMTSSYFDSFRYIHRAKIKALQEPAGAHREQSARGLAFALQRSSNEETMRTFRSGRWYGLTALIVASVSEFMSIIDRGTLSESFTAMAVAFALSAGVSDWFLERREYSHEELEAILVLRSRGI